MYKRLPNFNYFWTVAAAGAYTRPLLSSTYAVLVSEPCRVQFVKYEYWSYDPYVYRRYPTYPTGSAYVELRCGRV